MDVWDGCWGWWGWRRVLGVQQTLCPSVPGLNTASMLLGPTEPLVASHHGRGCPRHLSPWDPTGTHRNPAAPTLPT